MLNARRIPSSIIFLVLILAIVCNSGCDRGADSQYSSNAASSMSIVETTILPSVEATESSLESTNGTIATTGNFEKIEKQSPLAIETGGKYLVQDYPREYAMILCGGNAVKVDGVLNAYSIVPGESIAVMLLDRLENGPGRLVVSDGVSGTEISAHVSDYRVSANGESILFVGYDNTDNGQGGLFLYSVLLKESVRISDFSQGAICLSPDGKAVVFQDDQSDSTEDTTCQLWMDGKRASIDAEDMQPIAVADGGSAVYFIRNYSEKNAREFWVYSNKKWTQLSEQMYPYSESLLLNNDGTQVLFDDREGVTYWEIGTETTLIAPERRLTPVLEMFRKPHDYTSSQEETFIAEFSGTNFLRGTFFETYQFGGITHELGFFDEGNSFLPIASTENDKIFELFDWTLLYCESESHNIVYIPDIRTVSQGVETLERAKVILCENAGNSNLCLTDEGSAYISDLEGYTVYKDGKKTDIISSDFVLLDCLHRPDQPDVVYFKKILSENDDPVSTYVAAYYYDLYALEDSVSKEPSLVEEKVGCVIITEKDIYTLALEEVAGGIREYYENPNAYDEINQIGPIEEWDRNLISYSKDGLLFVEMGTIERRYLAGG